MQTRTRPQVLISGAGPVGLTAAAELARYGVSVRIIDVAAHRTDKSKALVLWSRTLELLDRAGCTPWFVAAGRPVTAANILTARERLAHVDMTCIRSSYNFALMLPQSDTERLLEEHLGRLGVTVERQVELTAFSADATGVTAALRHADGTQESAPADWLLACDGARSLVRHALGLPFTGETLPSDWILADCHLAGYPFPESEIAVYWHEDGVSAVFPISPGRFRVIADVPSSQDEHPPAPTIGEVQAVMDRRGPPGCRASQPLWLSTFRINERKVGSYRVGRVLLAGDAAHIHSPAGGQGMNTGMQDAFNLAWKLALVCQQACPEALLESYSQERSAVGDTVLKAAGRLTKLATLRNHGAQAIRNRIAHLAFGLAPVRDALARSMSEVSIGYPRSPLNGPGLHFTPGPDPGERVAPVAGEVPVGAGRAPRFALFARADGASAQLLGQFPHLMEPVVRAPLSEGGAWLVRPDGYVACAASEDEPGVIRDYLGALLARGRAA
jgi:2-polyprenyl-6-methoxyphenol hydroxylase-like FAD-dependent oxidoreductase